MNKPYNHVIWPSTVYRTPSVQFHLEQMCPVDHSEISLLCSKKVNLAISWHLGWMSATLLSESLALMSVALPPGSMVGTKTGVHQRVNCPPMSGVVSNASKLKRHWSLNGMSCVTIIMPQNLGIKVADKLKLPFLFGAHGALTWIQAISTCKPPIPTNSSWSKLINLP